VYLAESLFDARERGVDPMSVFDPAYLERMDVTQQMRTYIKMLDEV
jgi:hypothetical protein